MSKSYQYVSAADAYSTPAQGNRGNIHSNDTYSGYQPNAEHVASLDYPIRQSVEVPLNSAASPPIAGSEAYDAHQPHSQGYAPAKGRDEEEDQDDEDDDEDWNVYDDFNMTRPLPPRSSTSGLASQQEGYWDASKQSLIDTPYSDAPGHRKSLLPSEAFGFDVRNADPRRSVISHPNANNANNAANANRNSAYAVSGIGPSHADSTTGIELITVPALGNEFTKEEIRDMTRVSKRKKKRSHRKKKFSMWVSGNDHLWGWLSPRIAVFIVFFALAALAIVLYFVIPRIPTFAILSTTPVIAVPNGASMQVNFLPTNFSMNMDFNLRADNRGGWIPSAASDLRMEVTDIDTFMLVGAGNIDSLSFPGRQTKQFRFPVHFSYVSLNASGDQTFQDFYQACGANIPGVSRPTLNLGLKISMKIAGLVGTKSTNTQINNVACPFTLQNFQ